MAMEIQVHKCLSKVLSYEKKSEYGSVKQQKLYKGDEKQWLTWKRKIHVST